MTSKEKRKRVTITEVQKYCLKKRIELSFNECDYFNIGFRDKLKKTGNPKGEVNITADYDISIGDYEINKCDLVKSGKLKVKQEREGARIYIVDLSKDDLYAFVKVDDNNYIIAGDTSNVEKDKVKEQENKFFENNRLKPEKRRHFITFKKNEIENVLKQYLELQESSKETIHIFCSDEFENEILFYDRIIEFFNEEECKFIRFNNHIFKYKVEFHHEYSFNDEMKHILCFVDIDNESEIEEINETLSQTKTNFLLALLNSEVRGLLC